MGIYTIHQGNSEPVKDDEVGLPTLEADLYSVKFEDLIEESGIGCRAGTLHVVRVSIGTGILFMPYTLMHLGYIMGAAVFILAGIIYYYVARMALHTETKMCQQLKVSHLSYVELASHVFRASPSPFNKCGGLVKYFICIFYSIPFANTVYLVVMGKALHDLAKESGMNITHTMAVSVLIVPLTMFCMFRRILKILVPYSSVTNVITAGLAVAIIIVSMIDKTHLGGSILNNRPELGGLMVNETDLKALMINTGLLDPLTNQTILVVNEARSTFNKTGSIPIKAFGDITFIPKSLAMYIQVFSCTSLLFAMKSDMPKPQKLTKTLGILNVACFLVMVVHYFFGFSLYFIYGDHTKSDALKNMPQDSKVTLVINSLFCLTLFVSYILCFFARFNNVWTNTLKPNFKNETYAIVGEYVIRIGYNLFAFILAITIPKFDLVSAFAGSLSFIVDIGLSSLLAILYRVTYQKNNFWVIIKNVLIIVMCLVLFGVSMNENVNDIISIYSSNSDEEDDESI